MSSYSLQIPANPINISMKHAKRFAPIVWLYSGATYFPSSVDWYLTQVQLKLRDFPFPIFDIGHITANNYRQFINFDPNSVSPPIGPLPAGTKPFLGDSSNTGFNDNWYFDIPSDQDNPLKYGVIQYGYDYSQLPRPGAPRVGPILTISEAEQVLADNCPFYVHAFQSGNNNYIAYWFFYPYNDAEFADYDAHQADWEHIIVEVDTSFTTVQRVYLAQHKTSTSVWCTTTITGNPSRTVVKMDSTTHTRPIVYSAAKSHATYSDKGTTLHGPHSEPLDDTDKGYKWDPVISENLVRLNSDPVTDNANPWNRFLGNFGSSASQIVSPAMRSEWITPPTP